MNRLAQAMIAIAAEAQVSVEGPPAAVPAEAAPEAPRKRKSRKPVPTAPPISEEAAAGGASEPLEAEVLEAVPVALPKPPLTPGSFNPPDDHYPERIIASEVPQPVEQETSRRTPITIDPKNRRAAYRELVAYRRLHRALIDLKPFFAQPKEHLLRPALIFDCVRALHDFRKALQPRRLRDWPFTHGQKLYRIASDPRALALFRSLVESQRNDLAVEWTRSEAELKQRMVDLRAQLQKTQRSRGMGSDIRSARQWLRTHPEWLPVSLLIIAFMTSLIRTLARS
jgi:hypothetical protein